MNNIEVKININKEKEHLIYNINNNILKISIYVKNKQNIFKQKGNNILFNLNNKNNNLIIITIMNDILTIGYLEKNNYTKNYVSVYNFDYSINNWLILQKSHNHNN